MRTTLNIDDDALAVARSLAAQRKETIGTIVSELIRQAVGKQKSKLRRGSVPLLPTKRDSQAITMELVNDLRDGDT